jgi:hypothetical protein
MKRVIIVVALFLIAACGGKKTPTEPTPTPTPTVTKIVRLSGAMAFGNIQVGSSFSATLGVANDGNTALNVTGMSGTGGITSILTPSRTSFVVQPGTQENVTMTFKPTAPTTYSGNISVTSDATSGSGTIAFSGTGSLDGIAIFSRSGTGDQVFDLPSYVTRIRVTANTPSSCQNFAMKAGSSLIINVILGTCSVADEKTHDGTYIVTAGATIQTQISSGVNWTVTEQR